MLLAVFLLVAFESQYGVKIKVGRICGHNEAFGCPFRSHELTVSKLFTAAQKPHLALSETKCPQNHPFATKISDSNISVASGSLFEDIFKGHIGLQPKYPEENWL